MATDKTHGKRLGWLILFISSAGILWAALLATSTTREPTHGGRPLHAWIEDIDEITLHITSTNGITLQQTNAATTAILATADSAIPWLRSELRYHDPALRTRLRLLALRLPQYLGGYRVARQLQIAPSKAAWTRHRRAAMGALILGAKARSLAPDLAELLGEGDRCWLYTYALARMGVDGVPPLAWALTNRNAAIRRDAVNALKCTDAKLEPAVPALLYVLTNCNGFSLIQEVFKESPGASSAIIPFVEVASHHSKQVFRDNAAATLQVFKTRDPGYTNKQGWLHTDRFGNGSWQF